MKRYLRWICERFHKDFMQFPFSAYKYCNVCGRSWPNRWTEGVNLRSNICDPE